LQIIANTITFIGDANIALNGCDAYGVTYFGSPATSTNAISLVQ
jgi:hypothetical protein